MKIVEELQDEIRKLKAILVKHEKRIRILEAKPEEDSKLDVPPPAPQSEVPSAAGVGNNSHAETLEPDEV